MDNRRVFPSRNEDYVIEVSDKTRRSEIVSMLIENFLRDETLVKSLRLNANLTEFEESILRMDEELMMSTVVDTGTVIQAIHKETNRVSGALVIIVHEREPNDEKKNVTKKKSDPYEGRLKSKVIKDFYKYIEKIVEDSEDLLFEKYPNCKLYADFELIGINRIDRNKGIALDLYNAGLSVVKDIPGVSLLCGTYTSIYSKKIATKIGKTTVYSFDVTQLKDDCGNPVFQDTVPHNIVALMAMEI